MAVGLHLPHWLPIGMGKWMAKVHMPQGLHFLMRNAWNAEVPMLWLAECIMPAVIWKGCSCGYRSEHAFAARKVDDGAVMHKFEARVATGLCENAGTTVLDAVYRHLYRHVYRHVCRQTCL